MSITFSHRSTRSSSRSTKSSRSHARSKQQVSSLMVQSAWVFGLFMVLTYFVTAVGGNMLTELQRSKLKNVAPLLKTAESSVQSHRLRNATGATAEIEQWAVEHGYVLVGSVNKYASK